MLWCIIVGVLSVYFLFVLVWYCFVVVCIVLDVVSIRMFGLVLDIIVVRLLVCRWLMRLRVVGMVVVCWCWCNWFFVVLSSSDGLVVSVWISSVVCLLLVVVFVCDMLVGSIEWVWCVVSCLVGMSRMMVSLGCGCSIVVCGLLVGF